MVHPLLLCLFLSLSAFGMKRPAEQCESKKPKRDQSFIPLPQVDLIAFKAAYSGNIRYLKSIENQKASLFGLGLALNTALENENLTVIDKIIELMHKNEDRQDIVARIIAYHLNLHNKTLSPLQRIASFGNIALLNKALELGIKIGEDQDPTIYANKAFLAAIKYGHRAIAERLLLLGISQSSLNNALLEAAHKGHKDLVQLLLKHKASVNSKNQKGITPLMASAKGGHVEIVNLLLEAGAQVNERDSAGDTAFIKVMFCRSHPKIIRSIIDALVNAKADINKKNNKKGNALTYAYSIQPAEIAAKLISIGIRFPIDRTLSPAQEESSILFRTYIQAGDYLNNPVTYAQKFCEAYSSQSSQAFLASIKSSNDLHQTIFMWAALFGHSSVIELLCKNKLPLWLLNAQDRYGRTALTYSIIYGNLAITRMFLPLVGSGINLKDSENKTALMHTVMTQDIRLLYDLLAFGAKYKVQTIHYAAQLNLPSQIIVSLLFFCLGTAHPFK